MSTPEKRVAAHREVIRQTVSLLGECEKFFNGPVNMVDHFGMLYVAKRIDRSIEVYSASTDELLVKLPLEKDAELSLELLERLSFSLSAIHSHLIDPKAHYNACKRRFVELVSNAIPSGWASNKKAEWERVYTTSGVVLTIGWKVEEGFRVKFRRNPYFPEGSGNSEYEFEVLLNGTFEFMDIVKTLSPLNIGNLLDRCANIN